ncbi:MAG: co-chaperone GroES [Candidatus Dojkabacteria bacterium]
MAKAKLTPIGGNILVKPVEEEKKTASGIVIPDSASKEKPQRGEVIALGTGRVDADGKKVDFNVKVGDTVVFKKYGPDELEQDDETFLIMEESDILAVVK